jgi:hypothetical protein
MWKWRRHLNFIRWGLVATVCVLALVMSAPVWYVMAKLSDFFGGDGWHRAWLFDQAFSHIHEWWMFGTSYTAHWGEGGQVIYADPNMMDITNHYIMEGVKGGLVKLGLFTGIIVACFSAVGRVLRTRSSKSRAEFFVWTLGVSLFAHCVSFVSITYFDQIIIVWFWLLAVISRVAELHSVHPNFLLGRITSPLGRFRMVEGVAK